MGILVVWCVITYLSPAGGRLFEFGSFILYKINDISSTTEPGFFFRNGSEHMALNCNLTVLSMINFDILVLEEIPVCIEMSDFCIAFS